jgi:hypothetical protein
VCPLASIMTFFEVNNFKSYQRFYGKLRGGLWMESWLSVEVKKATPATSSPVAPATLSPVAPTAPSPIAPSPATPAN